MSGCPGLRPEGVSARRLDVLVGAEEIAGEDYLSPNPLSLRGEGAFGVLGGPPVHRLEDVLFPLFART
jgi:hypothetical protein